MTIDGCTSVDKDSLHENMTFFVLRCLATDDVLQRCHPIAEKQSHLSALTRVMPRLEQNILRRKGGRVTWPGCEEAFMRPHQSLEDGQQDWNFHLAGLSTDSRLPHPTLSRMAALISSNSP